MNCIAIDDQPIALEIIKSFCTKIPYLHLNETFTQVSEAQRFLSKYPPDLIFMDIQMPDANGIDFYKSVRIKPMVILTTAHSQYAVEGFNINAIDYLLKPIDFQRFEKACQKAKTFFEHRKLQSTEEAEFLYVRSEYALVKIPFSEILYIETMDDHLKIHQLGRKVIITLMSMKKIAEKLPEKQFVRIHRSFIVALDKVEAVRANTLSIGLQEIPIGTNYKKDFFSLYTRHFF